MSRPTIIAALLLLLGQGAAPARGQYYRDVIVLGDQHYLRTEQFPDAFSYAYCSSVCAQGGICAYTFWYWDGELTFDYLRHFDEWAQPIHEPVIINPDPYMYEVSALVDRWGSSTWTIWYDPRDVRRLDGRLFDPAGQAVGPVFTVSAVSRITDNLHAEALDVAANRVAIAWAQLGSGSDMDVYVRILAPDGEPLSDVITIADNDTYSEEFPAVAVLPSDAVLTAYHYGPRLVPSNLSLRRVNPDFTLEAPIVVEARRPAPWVQPHLRALADGNVLLAYSLADGSAGYARRLDAHGQPIGDPVPIDPGYWYAASTVDGHLALVGRSGGGPRAWLRLYDANGQALTERVDFSSGAYEQTSFPGPTFPLAYDDDGTIWIAWTGDSNQLLTSLKPFEPGDMNYDRRVDNFDITPFVMALADPAEYQAHYPGLPYQFLGDVNEDGAFDNFDISPFVELLTGQ